MFSPTQETSTQSARAHFANANHTGTAKKSEGIQAFQAKAWPNASKPLQKVATDSGDQAPIQMLTSIKMESQQIEWPVPLSTAYQWTVGSKTHAELDWSDTRKGTAPESPDNDPVHKLNHQFGARNFVRGHLLNARLGGLGIWDNMFPITGEANKKHASGIEATAKEYLIAAKNLDNQQGNTLLTHRVNYNVQAVAEQPKNFMADPNGRFVCTVGLRDFWGDRVDGYPDQSDIILSKHQHLDRGQEAALDQMGWGYNQTTGGSNRTGISNPTGYERENWYGGEGRIKDNAKGLFNTHSRIGAVNGGNLQNVDMTVKAAMNHIEDLADTLKGEARNNYLHDLEDTLGDRVLQSDLED